MTTPEGKIKEQVKRILKHYGVYWHCPVQNGMGAPSLDFICCHRGRYLGIETKAPKKKPTARQLLTMEQIENAGGDVFVIDGDTGLMGLTNWIIKVEHACSSQ